MQQKNPPSHHVLPMALLATAPEEDHVEIEL